MGLGLAGMLVCYGNLFEADGTVCLVCSQSPHWECIYSFVDDRVHLTKPGDSSS